MATHIAQPIEAKHTLDYQLRTVTTLLRIPCECGHAGAWYGSRDHAQRSFDRHAAQAEGKEPPPACGTLIESTGEGSTTPCSQASGVSDADFNLMVDATGPFLSHHLDFPAQFAATWEPSTADMAFQADEYHSPGLRIDSWH